MRFTLDLGNSRWKLRGWSDEARAAALRLDLAGTAEERLRELEGFLAERTGTRASFAVSAVIAPELEREVETCLARHGEVLELEPGLENRCREPERVGRDRLYAARAALDLAGASCVVVDAGTALTVDAVLARPGAPGVFLGGAIAPGPVLLARSLAQGAARLPAIEPAPGVSFLGRNSAEAIASGVVHGFRGAARELVRGVAADAGLAAAPAVITGGAARFLLEPPGLFAVPPLVHDDLVHLGLLAALDDSAPRPRRFP
jgi:type III pantothenate kinase